MSRSDRHRRGATMSERELERILLEEEDEEVVDKAIRDFLQSQQEVEYGGKVQSAGAI